MTCLSSTQLRALSAAAGVVGRPHLRAGLLLTLAVACGPVDPDEHADATTADDPATTSGTTAATTPDSTGMALTTSGGTGSADESTSLASTSSDDLTTGGTLLTDASTTGATDTGDLTTGDDTATTGGLDDCIDPTTLEVDWVCCEAQNWMPQPQCTPWGPPAPPSASHDLLARARAARLRLA